MKLYQLPGNCHFTICPGSSLKVPPGSPELATDEVYHFVHIDGLYSVCHDSHGKLVQVYAGCEVEQVATPAHQG